MSSRSLLLIALLLPSALTAQLTTDGNQYVLQGLNGLQDVPENNDSFGSALVIADFDGDGFEDAAIGVPGEDNARGLVHVLFGAADGLTTIDNQIWKPGVPPFPGNWESGDQNGAALAAGDFNGDGFADLAIGSPGEDSSQGNVNLLYGSQGDGLTLLGVAGVTQEGLEGSGPDNNDQFGFSLAVGDFNNDGKDDLAVGSPGESSSGGLIHVLYGAAGVGITKSGNQRWRQGSDGVDGGRENGDLFGYALATGDLNGDGYDDIVIGVPGEDNNKGRVQVLFGSSVGIVADNDQRYVQGEDGMPDKDENGDLFGIALAVGDFNGDGYDDIAASATGEDSSKGSVFIIPGSAGGPVRNQTLVYGQDTAGIDEQRENNDQFGSALAVGDFNRDGFDDLAIDSLGEDNGRGWVHVLYGSASGITTEGVQVFAQAWQGMQGVDRGNDLFGGALAAGDFGGDYSDDLLIGVPGEDGGQFRGAAQTLLGNDKPTIDAVASAGLGLPLVETLSPNALGAIFGHGLHGSAIGREVGPGDLVNGRLPTLVDRTCLEIDGQRGPLLFLRNDQINFQARNDGSGEMKLRVIRNCGEYYELRGDEFSVPVAPVSPDIFPSQIYQDGTKDIAAFNYTTGKFVGPTSRGPNFEPAKPGDIVLVYLTGAGLTNPPFEAGQLPKLDGSDVAPAASAVVFIDGVQAEAAGPVSAPGFAGVYQMNVVIPVTNNHGAVTIQITSSGGGPATTTPANSFIEVQ